MLTDEEIREIREQASKASGDWHFDMLLYARAIERAVLEKAGEQLRYTSDGALAECPCCGSLDVGGAHDNVHCYGCGLNITKERPLKNAIEAWNRRAHPLPAQAIPEKLQYSDDDDGDFSHAHVNGYNDAIDAMLSAPPKP